MRRIEGRQFGMTPVAAPAPVQDVPVDAFEVPVAFARSGDLFRHRMTRLARRIDGQGVPGNFGWEDRGLSVAEFREIPAENPTLENGWSDERSFQACLAVQAVEAGRLACGVEARNRLPAGVQNTAFQI